MKRHPETRLFLQKLLLCALCFLLFCASLCVSPFLAAAIPAELGQALSGSLPPPGFTPLKAVPAVSEAPESAPPESEEPVSEEPQEPVSEPAPPPENACFVSSRDLCRYEKELPVLLIGDETGLGIDPERYLSRAFPLTLPDTAEPTVLIMHTHGTESYLPDGTDYYLPDEPFRSETPENTVIAVGEQIAEILRARGIGVLHDETMYDKEDFNTAYVSASKGIRALLAKYPTITYILDVHRDSVFTENGTCVKPVTEINGRQTAQLMLVVGSDTDGSHCYPWRTNFTVAAHLQQALNDRYPTLARPVNLRTWAFNQHLCTGALLVEIGSCGNTLSEALCAASLFADVFADVIT